MAISPYTQLSGSRAAPCRVEDVIRLVPTTWPPIGVIMAFFCVSARLGCGFGRERHSLVRRFIITAGVARMAVSV